MVKFSYVFISFGLGLCAFCIPALLAPSLPSRTQQWFVNKYAWLTATSLWRPTLVRRELGGYTLTSRSYDKEKRVDTVDDDLDIHDPDKRIYRWASKPLAGVYEDTPIAVDADLAELGEHHHQHVKQDKHKKPGDALNPYVEVQDEMQLCDFAKAYHLIPNAGDPSDPETVQSLIARAMAKYGRSFNKTEALVGVLGFLGGLGAVVFAQRYILKGGGGGGDVSAPIPIGYLDAGLVDPVMSAIITVI